MPKTATKGAASAIDPYRLYTKEEIADLMGITPWQVRNLVRENRIGRVKTGPTRGWRISRQNYLDYIAANSVPAE